MLDELLGTWLDKRKAKKELIKAFKFYHKEYRKAYAHYRHTFDTDFLNENYDIINEAYNNMQSLEKIVKALAYVLYSNFHMYGWEDKCWIETYYELYKDEGKVYLDEINKIHDDNYSYVIMSDDKEMRLNALNNKGTIMHCLENNSFYVWDGKNFLKIN